jgi:hypothetical protein
MAVFVLMIVMAGGVRARVLPESLGQAFEQASPEQRLAAWRLVVQEYPQVPAELRQHLRQVYPGFELRLGRAALAVLEAHPGLAWELPRHLLEDLDGEPARAALDLADAVRGRYPSFFGRLRQLAQEHSPRLAARQAVVRSYPGFPGDVLALLRARHAGAGARLASQALAVLAEEFPDLRLAVAEDLVRHVQQNYPELPLQMMEARRQGQRPLAWLVANRPEVAADLTRRVVEGHGSRMRACARAVLARWQKTDPSLPSRVLADLLGLVAERYPELPQVAWEARAQARLGLAQAVLAEFPELPQIVAQTLSTRHPDLAARLRRSLETHYPGLRDEVARALEKECPGLPHQVQQFLESRHPDLLRRLEQVLRG